MFHALSFHSKSPSSVTLILFFLRSIRDFVASWDLDYIRHAVWIYLFGSSFFLSAWEWADHDWIKFFWVNLSFKYCFKCILLLLVEYSYSVALLLYLPPPHALPFTEQSVISALIFHVEQPCLFGFYQKQRLWVETDTENKLLIGGKGTYITSVCLPNAPAWHTQQSDAPMTWGNVVRTERFTVQTSGLRTHICCEKWTSAAHASIKMIYYYYCPGVQRRVLQLCDLKRLFDPHNKGNPDENTRQSYSEFLGMNIIRF